MDEFIKKLYGKNIHIIGVTGSEGSSILRFLIKNNILNVKVHDLLIEGSIEKSYKLWHKGIENKEREKAYQQFSSDLSHLEFYTGESYLKGIDEAEIIFVPQSWRLYKDNLPLIRLNIKNKAKFYSLMRLYLDFAKAKIVGITGTVGKGSVANLLYEILRKSLPPGRDVYFAGNETWRIQLVDQLDSMKREDILILEISHRQLLDGFKRSPNILIFTNLFPNHLDEMTYEEYKRLKLSLLITQTNQDICVLNYDNEELRKVAGMLSSNIYFFSAKKQDMNIKYVQSIFKYFLNNKNLHYFENILASSTAAIQLGIHDAQIIDIVQNTQPLTARLNLIFTHSGINFFNDIKSTTPWATLAAVNKLGINTILICGGRTKGIDCKNFFVEVNKKVLKIILLESELSHEAGKYIGMKELFIVSNLEEAIKLGSKLAKSGDNILVSPAAGYFYSDFIKNKKTLRKIITSLPPKEQV